VPEEHVGVSFGACPPGMLDDGGGQSPPSAPDSRSSAGGVQLGTRSLAASDAHPLPHDDPAAAAAAVEEDERVSHQRASRQHLLRLLELDAAASASPSSQLQHEQQLTATTLEGGSSSSFSVSAQNASESMTMVRIYRFIDTKNCFTTYFFTLP
jgi:hypothetical protein